MSNPKPFEHFNAGDRVMITFDDERAEGTVVFASGNGVSLMLSFEGMLGAYVGSMPVLWDINGDPPRWRDLVTGGTVILERVAGHNGPGSLPKGFGGI